MFALLTVNASYGDVVINTTALDDACALWQEHVQDVHSSCTFMCVRLRGWVSIIMFVAIRSYVNIYIYI